MRSRLLRVFMVLGVGLCLALGSALAWLASPPTFPDPWPVDSQRLSLYQETYEETRSAFQSACQELMSQLPGTLEQSLSVPGQKGTDLTIDVCSVPSSPGKEDRLLIMTSGLHGAEGYASSAVMRQYMKSLASSTLRPALLFVHGINPFGMKYYRRYTENGVDLNRNFSEDTALFDVKNDGYLMLSDMLNPQTQADPYAIGTRLFAARAIQLILVHGMSPLRQAIVQGQYTQPNGIYFGGMAFEPQKDLVSPLLREAMRGKSLVLTLDLHAGYGERGTAHLFPNAPKDDAQRELTEKMFEGYRVDWGDTEDFYTTYGDFSAYVGTLAEGSTRYVPMVIEYGTLDSQTTKGSIHSLHISILENQAYHHGCVSEAGCTEIQRRAREMFFPSSPAWRSHILETTEELLATVTPRLLTL